DNLKFLPFSEQLWQNIQRRSFALRYTRRARGNVVVKPGFQVPQVRGRVVVPFVTACPSINGGQLALPEVGQEKQARAPFPRPDLKNAYGVRAIEDFRKGETPGHNIHVEPAFLELSLCRFRLKLRSNLSNVLCRARRKPQLHQAIAQSVGKVMPQHRRTHSSDPPKK